MNNKTEEQAEKLFLEKYGNKITASESWVIRFASEFASQQNKAQQSNIEILRADNKANIEKIEALESELSKQKDKIAELENTNAGFEGIIKSHKEIIKNLEDDASKQKELVEEKEKECEDRILNLHLKNIKLIQEYAKQLSLKEARIKELEEGLQGLGKEAEDLMDFCIDRGYLDNEDLTDGQIDFNKAVEVARNLLFTPTKEPKEVEGKFYYCDNCINKLACYLFDECGNKDNHDPLH